MDKHNPPICCDQSRRERGGNGKATHVRTVLIMREEIFQTVA
jgi:hypothetical protein